MATPFGEDEGCEDHGTEATSEMIQSLRNFVNKDKVKASMAMGDASKRAFDDKVARVKSKYRKTCPNLEVVDDSALTSKNHDAGSIKT